MESCQNVDDNKNDIFTEEKESNLTLKYMFSILFINKLIN